MYLAQTDQIESFAHLGESAWTVIGDSSHESADHSLGVYCALSSPEQREKALSDAAWDLSVTAGGPGFSQSWPDGSQVTTYHPVMAREDGVETLVLHREYHGAAEDKIELDQQFRLFHNLRWDPRTGT